MRLLLRFLINAFALAGAAYVVPGFKIHDWTSLLVLSLVFGLVNMLVRPILALLSCALIVLTLGLFTLVINAATLMLAVRLGRELGLRVTLDGFVPAFLAALIVTAVSTVLSWALPDDRGRRDDT